jgi:hypothetical protein
MESHESEEMRDRLVVIREKLARMREESRESLERLAATREQADGRAAIRRDDRSHAAPPPAP